LQNGGIADWQTANYAVTLSDARSPNVSLAWAACAHSSTNSPTNVVNNGSITDLTLDQSFNRWVAGDFDFVLDARTNGELDWNGTILPGWQQVHIPQAVSSDSHKTIINSTDACKPKPILVHCWGGVAAARLASELASNGFTNLYVLKDGGIADWQAANYTVTVDESRPPAVSLNWADCVESSGAASAVTYFTFTQFWTEWTTGDFDFVLDARTDDELDWNGTILPGWKQVHIPGAVSSSHKVAINSTDACKSSKILVHCWTGVAAATLAEQLASNGFTNVYALQNGGIADWQAANYAVTVNEARSPDVSLAWAACASPVGTSEAATESTTHDATTDVPTDAPTSSSQFLGDGAFGCHVSALALVLLTAILDRTV